MKIIIGGAGAVGTHLAQLLSKEKQDIVLMDEKIERLQHLSSAFDLMVMNASPTSIKAQKNAGVADADMFILGTEDVGDGPALRLRIFVNDAVADE